MSDLNYFMTHFGQSCLHFLPYNLAFLLWINVFPLVYLTNEKRNIITSFYETSKNM